MKSLGRFVDILRNVRGALSFSGSSAPGGALPPGNWLTRDDMLHLALKFAGINKVEGDYLEFGTYRGNTFLSAWRYGRFYLPGARYFLFDSFQGLPEPQDVDAGDIFETGQYCCGLDEFIRICDEAGIPSDGYSCIKGFYGDSLTEELRGQLPLRKAAVVYIDCDLYESTIQVLTWLTPYLQTGSIVCFDDYYCFKGAPNKGEQLALREYSDAHAEFVFNDWHLFAWHGKSFVVYRKEGTDHGN